MACRGRDGSEPGHPQCSCLATPWQEGWKASEKGGTAAIICLENEAVCRGQSGSVCLHVQDVLTVLPWQLWGSTSHRLSYSALCEMSSFRGIRLRMGLFTQHFCGLGSIWGHSLPYLGDLRDPFRILIQRDLFACFFVFFSWSTWIRAVLSVQIHSAGGRVGNLSGEFYGDAPPGPYSSSLSSSVSRESTRDTGTAEYSQRTSPHLLSCSMESSSCPIHRTL